MHENVGFRWRSTQPTGLLTKHQKFAGDPSERKALRMTAPVLSLDLFITPRPSRLCRHARIIIPNRQHRSSVCHEPRHIVR